MKRRFRRRRKDDAEGEFLWLISLSDLMILLFIFFVVMYAFTHKKLKQSDVAEILNALGNRRIKDPVEQIRQDVTRWVEENGLQKLIEVKRKNGDLVVEIKDKVFFESGEYQLHRKGELTMVALSKVLEAVPPPYQLGIEGHTDDVPIRTRTINSNWDLSAKRALSVLRALRLPRSMEERTVVMAYGDTRPLVPNRSPAGKPLPENRSQNRRVTLRIF